MILGCSLVVGGLGWAIRGSGRWDWVSMVYSLEVDPRGLALMRFHVVTKWSNFLPLHVDICNGQAKCNEPLIIGRRESYHFKFLFSISYVFFLHEGWCLSCGDIWWIYIQSSSWCSLGCSQWWRRKIIYR